MSQKHAYVFIFAYRLPNGQSLTAHTLRRAKRPQRSCRPLKFCGQLHQTSHRLHRRGKHLRVGSPAQTLVPLRTIGRHRQIVGILPPADIFKKAVYPAVGSAQVSRIRSNGRYHLPRNGMEKHGSVGSYLKVPETVVGVRRMVLFGSAATQNVLCGGFCRAQRLEIRRAFRAVVAAAATPVAPFSSGGFTPRRTCLPLYHKAFRISRITALHFAARRRKLFAKIKLNFLYT